MHALQRKIREAKQQGKRWSTQEIEEAENLASAMLDEPETRTAVWASLIQEEGKNKD